MSSHCACVHCKRVRPQFLAHPPKPLPRTVSEDHYPTITPPSSPERTPPVLPDLDDDNPFQAPNGDFLHWGYLKPLCDESNHTNWFFKRTMDIYAIGSRVSMDIRVGVPVMQDHLCSIIWCSEDDTVIFLSNYNPSCAPADGVMYGTFVNGESLIEGESRNLHHGDNVRLYPTACVSPDDDLNFVWLQCTEQGWLPRVYKQYPWPPPRYCLWGEGKFD